MTGAGARSTRRARRARAFALVILALAATTPRSSRAQAAGESPRASSSGGRHFPRRYLYAALGGGLGLGLSQLYTAGKSYAGTCTSASCVTIVSAGGGALLGYLIGRESDELHTLRYKAGAPLSPRITSGALGGEPLFVAARDSLVAVAGASGVDVFISARAGLAMAARRAAGIRGITGADLVPRSGALALVSSSGFYLYPAGTGPGSLLRGGGAAAAVATTGDRAFVATGTRVESVPLSADSSRTWPGIDLARTVHALAWDAQRSLLWAAADSDLVTLRPEGDSLAVVGVIRLGAPGRRVAALGRRVAVALGEGGVRLFDVADPTAPVERAHWTAARFAYDVALSTTRLFVAAGGDGLYVLDADGGASPVIGLVRDVGFAVGVTVRGDNAYVIDREGRALRRMPTAF